MDLQSIHSKFKFGHKVGLICVSWQLLLPSVDSVLSNALSSTFVRVFLSSLNDVHLPDDKLASEELGRRLSNLWWVTLMGGIDSLRNYLSYGRFSGGVVWRFLSLLCDLTFLGLDIFIHFDGFLLSLFLTLLGTWSHTLFRFHIYNK